MACVQAEVAPSVEVEVAPCAKVEVAPAEVALYVQLEMKYQANKKEFK